MVDYVYFLMFVSVMWGFMVFIVNNVSKGC